MKSAHLHTTTASYHQLRTVGISLIASMGGLLFGYDLGVITGVIPFIQEQYSLSGFNLGWVVAVFELGCMAGAFAIGPVTEKFGRKTALLYTAVFFILTTLGIISAVSATGLALWRFAQGIAVGAASVLSPMYIAEISPRNIRGKLIALNQLMIIFGILAATFVSYEFGDPLNKNSWRIMFGFALLPSGLFLSLLFLIPETPRWLLKKNRPAKAEVVLTRFGDESYVRTELAAMQASLMPAEVQGSLRELFSKRMLPVMQLGVGLAILQQFCGSNNVTAYLQVIFLKAHIDIKDGLLNAVFVGLVFFCFTVLAIILVDKMGRKKLMLGGTLLLALFLFGLAFTFNSEQVNGKLVFIFVMGFIATYAFTLAPVTWIVLAEIFPNRLRSKGMSVASATLWLSCFLVVLISPYLLRLSAVFNFSLFACLNLAGYLFVWKRLPETRGKSLEEIEETLLKPAVSKTHKRV